MNTPRIPTAIKKLNGTAQHNPQRIRNEPQPRLANPDSPIPRSLRNRYSREQWVILSALLAEVKVLTEADKLSLEMLCESYGRYRVARSARARDIAFDQTLKLLRELGLTPASRTKVSMVNAPAKDPFDTWQQKGVA